MGSKFSSGLGSHVGILKYFIIKCLVSQKLLDISFFQAQILAQRQILHQIGLVLKTFS